MKSDDMGEVEMLFPFFWIKGEMSSGHFQNLDNFILFTSNMQVTLDFYICIISGEV